ncbi:MAG: hypothetical protein ABJF11_20250 [Reichenbachiella sp.]|uniref:hypothetical protein n=1 Tax=Reichenbachiella sp. TaxID=2184521 RepID=UPI003265AE07
MNRSYASLPWDTSQSTYQQEIILENGKSFPGYSKRLGKEEAKDKRILLQNLILRMYQAGYLDENNPQRDNAVQITYSWKDDSTGRYVHAFTLYQDCYEWNPNHYRDYLDKFLTRFYELKRSGKNPYEHLYETKRAKFLDPLSITNQRFFNKVNLRNYCVRLIKNNIRAFGEVLNFYIKYCERYFDGFTSEDQSYFDNIKFG